MSNLSAGAGHQVGRETTGVLEVDDPSLYEQAVRPWELLTQPLSSGPFRYRQRQLVCGPLVLYDERYGSPVRLLGASPSNMLVVAVPLRPSAHARLWKAPLAEDQIPAMLPGGLEAVFGPGHRQVTMLIEHGLLRRYLPSEQVEQIVTVSAERRLPCTTARLAELRHWLVGTMQQLSERPTALVHSAAVSAFSEDLIRRLASAALSLERQAGRRPPVSARHRDLRCVLDFLRDSEPADLTVADLCRNLAIGERSLEYAFRDIFDLTPRAFLKLRRLHTARRRLLAADPADMAVADIAYQEGFYHLGRFADVYRRSFGERPSETLRRPAAKVPRGLKI